MGKKRIAVLMGGLSSEHDVSLNSGRGVLGALDAARYEGIGVTIARDGRWDFGDGAAVSVYDAVPKLRDLAIDCVFIALHGPFGEDGRLQGLLDLIGMPYTGSGCMASALAMDKVRAKAIVRDEEIPVADEAVFDVHTWREDAGEILDAVAEEIGFPCVVKPALLGSSVGVSIVEEEEQLRGAIEQAFDVDQCVMVESFLEGIEVTCAVLDVRPGEACRALPVTEIRPQTADFFDYEAKYTPGATIEITPAEISKELSAAVQEMAVAAHEAIGCAIWSRSDFIIDDEEPVFIEVNTVPGLTETSLYPQACAAVGISYQEMTSLFIEAALAGTHKE